MRPGEDALAVRGSNATDVIGSSVCPLKVWMGLAVSASQRIAVLSRDPVSDAALPSAALSTTDETELVNSPP